MCYTPQKKTTTSALEPKPLRRSKRNRDPDDDDDDDEPRVPKQQRTELTEDNLRELEEMEAPGAKQPSSRRSSTAARGHSTAWESTL
jgi:hypothetical protein